MPTFSGNATAGTAALTGGLSLLGGNTGPTEEQRRRMYAGQQNVVTGAIQGAEADARRQAAGSAATAMGGGNPFLAGRLGAQAGGEAATRIASQGLQQQAQLASQQQQQEMAIKTQQANAGIQRLGGLLGAGGQVLGMAIPAFGALRGAAGATGMTGALSGSGNPVGGLLGSALGGGQPQPAPPQAPTMAGAAQGGAVGWGQQAQSPLGFSGGMGAPAGMRWDPVTGRMVPA